MTPCTLPMLVQANSIFEELFGGMGMGGMGMGGMGGRRRGRGMGGMFGGMGGPGGFSFFGPGFGDDEMMSDQGMGGGPKQQEVDLPVPLEQLFTGTTKVSSAAHHLFLLNDATPQLVMCVRAAAGHRRWLPLKILRCVLVVLSIGEHLGLPL